MDLNPTVPIWPTAEPASGFVGFLVHLLSPSPSVARRRIAFPRSCIAVCIAMQAPSNACAAIGKIPLSDHPGSGHR